MDDDRRRSPTPPHNTREFQTWVDFAEAMIPALADYPPSDEVREVVLKLEAHRAVFATWTRDARARPAPTERLPELSAFMETRGRSIDLLGRLAKEHPEIAAAALECHREAARRARSRGGG